jgi:UDP-N-acetylmuramoyl-tripeptide--D-alanyl-D-alanine ligase
VPEKKIKSAIENYVPSNSRSQLIEKNSNKIILDAYNANPSSMKLAIENFAKRNSENKILLLGAMAELGKESLSEHQQIIDLIRKYSWKEVALVGGDFLNLPHPFHSFENSLQTKKWFVDQHFKNSYILVKGSRSMQMEKALED